MKQTEILTHATHVNGWFPAVYMSCMSQNFRLFHVSNLSVRNFRIFLLIYTGSLCSLRVASLGDEAGATAPSYEPAVRTTFSLNSRREVTPGRPDKHIYPGYMSRKIESLGQINSMRIRNGSFDSCSLCKRSCLRELRESKLSFVLRIEFIRSKLSTFSAHVSVVIELDGGREARLGGRRVLTS